MNLLITGGAGFIGSNLARHAITEGHSVRVIDNLSTGYRQNLEGLEIDLFEEDILDEKALENAMKGANAVVHLAALGSVPRSVKDPVSTHEVNARGTLNVLLAARDAGVDHVSVASSSSVYGLNPTMPKSERTWVRAMSPYAVSKLATEQYALAFQQAYGIRTLAFRFFNVYGPWQRAGHVYAAVIPIFVDAILRGKALPVNGDGTNSRDFTYVDTVSSVLLDAAVRRVTHPEPVNLAFGTNTSLLDLANNLSAITGRDLDIEFREPRVGDVPHSQADSTSLEHLFPDLAPVTLQVGLSRTLEWMREQLSR